LFFSDLKFYNISIGFQTVQVFRVNYTIFGIRKHRILNLQVLVITEYDMFLKTNIFKIYTMNKVIVTTQEELAEMIDFSVASKIDPLRDLIYKKLNPQKKNVTVKEAATMLNVSELSIRNYIKNGKIQASKIGRRIVINLESLENSLKEVKSLKYRR
jgi:excisionase family DNA binding protein